jgi:hypothetical protein
MIAWQTVTFRAAVIGRWMAIFFGSLLALFFLAFFFGEGPPRFFSELTAPERVPFIATFALYLGLAIANKWEGLGGVLALAGFASLVPSTRAI